MKEYLRERQEVVDAVIESYLSELKYPHVIAEGMKYSVLNGGKRLRPILLIMCLELLGKDMRFGLPTAVAIELIHSYSLVHDDLPALDDDDYRRGQLTAHKKFGEAEAILIGDALLTHAFSILTKKNKEISAEKIVKIIELTADYAGINGMIGGQMIDLESENKRVELPTLQYIHTHKTGMMLRLPVEAACIIADVDKDTYDTLLEYAELIGLAFQIKDDILDIEGDFEKIGKAVGSDEKLQKSTYPSLFGLERTKEILKEKVEKAKKIIQDKFGEGGDHLVQLADFIANRDK